MLKIFKKLLNINNVDKLFILVWLITVLLQIHYFNQVQLHLNENSEGLVGFTSEHGYDTLAKKFLNHGKDGFKIQADDWLIRYRPPLYPIILSGWYKIYGEDRFSALVFNNVLLSLTVIVVFLTGRLINPVVGLISAIIIFIDPVIIKRANAIQSEIPFMFFMSVFIFFLLIYFTKRKSIMYLSIFSFFFILSSFTRAVTVYFPYFVPLIVLIYIYYLKDGYNQHISFILIIILISSIPTGLWMKRNYEISGNSDFAGMKAVHLFNFLAPISVARSQDISYSKAKQMLENKWLNNNEFKSMSVGEKENYKKIIAINVLKDNWIGFTSHYISGFHKLFIGYDASVYWLNYSPKKYGKLKEFRKMGVGISRIKLLFYQGYWDYLLYSIVIILFYLTNIILCLGGFINVIIYGEVKQKRFGIYLLTLFLYIVFITSLWPLARLRTQIMPIMSLMSSLFIYKLLKKKNFKSSFKRIISCN